MSTYGSVKATSLKSVVNTALNELNSHSLSTIRDNLNNNSVMSSSVKSVTHEKIGKIIDSSNNGSISNLKKHLNNLKSACDYIEKIQSLESDIAYLKKYKLKDSEGNIDSNVQYQIYSKQNLVSSYESKVNNYLS